MSTAWVNTVLTKSCDVRIWKPVWTYWKTCHTNKRIFNITCSQPIKLINTKSNTASKYNYRLRNSFIVSMVDTNAQSGNNYWEPIMCTQTIVGYKLYEQIAHTRWQALNWGTNKVVLENTEGEDRTASTAKGYWKSRLISFLWCLYPRRQLGPSTHYPLITVPACLE